MRTRPSPPTVPTRDRAVPLRDGARLHVVESGDPAAPVTIVLMHGWTLSSRLWHRQIPALSGPDVRVVAYDARGHGRSSAAPLATSTLRHLADDLAEVLDATAPHTDVVLVGHSMGGMTIMEYAALHPDQFGTRITGTALVATAADQLSRESPAWLGRAERHAYRALARAGVWRPHRVLTPALWWGLRRLVFGRTAEFASVRLSTAMVAGSTLRTIGGFHPALTAHRRLPALAALADVPVAVLAGTRDRLTPPSRAERMVAVLPHATHLVFPDAGHMLPLERPDQVTRAITDVVAAVRSRR